MSVIFRSPLDGTGGFSTGISFGIKLSVLGIEIISPEAITAPSLGVGVGGDDFTGIGVEEGTSGVSFAGVT